MDDDFPPIHRLEPVCQPSAIHVRPAPAAFSIQLLISDSMYLPSILCLPHSFVHCVAADLSCETCQPAMQ